MPLQPAMRTSIAAAYLLIVFLLIYAPIVGQGFVADDFGWVSAARPSVAAATVNALSHTTGFYRPFVSVSFAVNHAISGLNPRPYGLTNLLLLLTCAGLVGSLACLAGLPPAVSLLAAALFAFNPHGVDMALLWVSGRTALLLTMFSLAAAVAFVKRRTWLSAALVFCALLSKEEALVLPAVFLVWAFLEARGEVGSRQAIGVALRRTRWIWLVLVPYGALRLHSGAMVPANAPGYYRFSVDPLLLARNAREYADRACSFSGLAAAAVFLLARSRPSLTTERRLLLSRSLCWLMGGFALTIFLPVRSSLYALFPSVGAALAATTLIAAWWSPLSLTQKRGLIVAALILPLALFPVYRSRADRWVASARLSSSVTMQLVQEVAAHPEARAIVLQDDRSTRANLANAFGPAASDVASLFFARPVTLTITPTSVTHVSPGELLFVLDGRTGQLRPAN